MHKKKVLIIVANLRLGGQERVAVNTAEILKDDYEVVMAVFDGRNAVYTPCCELIDINIPSKNGKVSKIINVIRRSIHLHRLKRIRKIDVSYSFGTTANIVNAFSKCHDKVLVSIRGYRNATNNLLNKLTFSLSDVILGCSQAISEKLKLSFPQFLSKFDYLYNPCDIPQIKRLGKNNVSDYQFSSHTIVTHGRLNVVKNYPRLVKAYSIVKQSIPDAQLLIIGEGPERKKLESLVFRYKLQDSVTLLGFRENPFAYISKASLYVLSSFNEGFPNALIEGMTFLPVVSVDCKSGPREILYQDVTTNETVGYCKADYGVIVQPAIQAGFINEITPDDTVLADAIVYILSNKVELDKYREFASNRVLDFCHEAYKDNLCFLLNRGDYD